MISKAHKLLPSDTKIKEFYDEVKKKHDDFE